MKEKLEQLIQNAYTPYYKFPVACIVVTKDNQEFSGVNVENANGTSICAERNAIAAAITGGYTKENLDKLYVMTNSSKNIWPCFACRQVILEFFNKNSQIISINNEGIMEMHTVNELCPYAFTNEDLKWEVFL